ncbi:leucine-rich repeat protein [Eubacterium sp.]|uniref:leucine-rich repeat domain-containing protein n=1 Tax=Eubacterium sp. TaxID=142586 RepID=UPI003F0E94CD
MKKAISIILSVLMIISVTAGLDFSAYADIVVGNDQYEGKCGESITYTFDEATGTLTLTGTGDMYDYGLDEVPWESYRKSISKITINKGITSIGNCSFEFCGTFSNDIYEDGILEVNIPNTVTHIGYFAFRYSKIKNIYLPSSVTSIGDLAFSGCYNLESIVVDSANPVYKSISGVLYGPDNKTGDYSLIQCPHETGFTSIVIPNNVKIIEDMAFSYCRNITDITIPESVIKIKSRAFEGTSISNIFIPKNVLEISDCFNDCCKLKTIRVDSQNPNHYVDSYGVLYEQNNDNGEIYDTLVAYPHASENKSYVMPDSVKYSNDISSNNLQSIVIGSECNHIAWISSDNLKEIKVNSGNDYYTVKDNVLYKKEYLTEYEIEKILNTLGTSYYNKYINPYDDTVAEIICYPKKSENTELTIPSTIKINSKDYPVFRSNRIKNNNLKKITIPDGIYDFTIDSDSLEAIENKSETLVNFYIDAINVTEIKLPKSIKKLYINIGNTATTEKGLKIEAEATEKFNELTKQEQDIIYNQFVKNDRDIIGKLKLGVYLTNTSLSDVYGSDIYYNGTKNDWSNISIETCFDDNTVISRIHCTDGDINVVDKKTAQTTSKTGLENKVKVDYTDDVDIFDESKGEVTLNAEIVDNITTIDNINTIVTYDLKLYQNGKIVQPKGYVKVTIPKPLGIKNPKVIYVDENNKSTIIPTIDNGDGTLSFQTNHFSIYAIYEASSVEPAPSPGPTPGGGGGGGGGAPAPTPEPETPEETEQKPETTPTPTPAPTTSSNAITYKGETIKPNTNGEYVSKKAKRPAISKLTKGRKAFKVTWKKISGVSGYQIQYSTSKKFTKKTTKTVYSKGNKKFAKTIKNLKSAKKYYVRIRTYKIVNGKKIFSGWSKIRTVVTTK